MAAINARDVWKCFTKDSGEQCVMTGGILKMLGLSADSWAVGSPSQHQERPSSGKALGLFSWMTCSAEGTKLTYGNAPTAVGQDITVATVKMPVLSAQVRSALFSSRISLDIDFEVQLEIIRSRAHDKNHSFSAAVDY